MFVFIGAWVSRWLLGHKMKNLFKKSVFLNGFGVFFDGSGAFFCAFYGFGVVFEGF